MASVSIVTVVVIVAVGMASVIKSLVTVVSWTMSAYILVQAYFGLFGIDVLIGGRNHLANPLWWLAIKLGAEVAVMESSDEGGDDLCFRDVGNIIPHLRKASNVASEELGRLLVDAV